MRRQGPTLQRRRTLAISIHIFISPAFFTVPLSCPQPRPPFFPEPAPVLLPRPWTATNNGWLSEYAPRPAGHALPRARLLLKPIPSLGFQESGALGSLRRRPPLGLGGWAGFPPDPPWRGPCPLGGCEGPASAPRPDLTIQRPWRLLEQRLSSSSPALISLNAFLRDGTLSGQVKGSALLRGPD